MKIMNLINEMGHEQLVFCQDKKTGLKAIIAIHDTTLGPALGGCRFWNYQSEEEAIIDVLKLSRGMTYKASIANLALGGGKAVIIGDPLKLKSESFFRAFGKFVDRLNGQYITAEDVNIGVEDINNVARETRHVVGGSRRLGGSGDPSPSTALGVYYGIKACVKHKLAKDDISGLTFAVQGCGAVGRHLCQLLHEDGAQLVVSDIDSNKVTQLVNKYACRSVSFNDIHKVEADVYTPCALGGVLNPETIPQIQSTIVAGAANNQLLDEKRDSTLLHEKGILYAPDYVINAGGLINVAHELRGYQKAAADRDVINIYQTLLNIFYSAKDRHVLPSEASYILARQRIDQEKKKKISEKGYSYSNVAIKNHQLSDQP